MTTAKVVDFKKLILVIERIIKSIELFNRIKYKLT